MSKFSDKKIVNDIRLLALDMINEAESGHPGIALDAAPMLYTLFSKHINMDLEHPKWVNRDRFVMSCGHGSAVLYATLFATTNDYTLDDLKNFRKINSLTPGHPEYTKDNRIDATTGALGQGFATAVGMAISEKYLEATYNKKKNKLFDYKVYCLVSDGDLMEGISYEAMSLAGTLALDNLIVLYDSNEITIDGKIDRTYTESTIDRFIAADWDVIHVKDGDSISSINSAIEKAKKNKKPTLIGIDTVLGIYSKNEDTNKVHSGKLDNDDLENIRKELKGLGYFKPDMENIELSRLKVKERCTDNFNDWYSDYELYTANMETDLERDNLNSIVNNEEITLKIDKVIDMDKIFHDKPLRDINYQIMNVIGNFVPSFMGGSADLVTSTKTYLKGMGEFSPKNYKGRNIAFGVRENLMGAVLNGMALSNLRPFGSTFLTFSDYLKPSLRLSAIMNLPVTYIFTHDSFLIGEDGITHAPIEQLAMLRTIPNLQVYRPCDYKELIGSWNLTLNEAKPTCIILPRNNTNNFEYTSIKAVEHGAYVISEVKNRLDVILIATGSEVGTAMKIKEELLKNFIEARVISMPNVEKFLNEEDAYKQQILPRGYKKIVIEFSNDPIWYRFVDSKEDLINITNYSKSGSPEELTKDFELDITSLVIKIKNNL